MANVQLTDLESIVYKALLANEFASGINPEGNDAQTGLPETLAECKLYNISPSSFAGILGSLAKKGLYQSVPCDSDDMPHKTIIINGRKEKIRTDIGSVITIDQGE
jgi:hypothetical protein